MKIKLLMLTVAVSCAFAGNAMALTKEEYKVQKDTVSADYKANRDKCAALKANAKEIYVSEAKGMDKVAKAAYVKAKEDANAARVSAAASKDKAEKMSNVKKNASAEKREAGYKAAKERCDSLAGPAKDTCENDAKAKYGMK